MNENNFVGDLSILDLLNLYEIYRSRQKEHESDEFTNLLIRALAKEVQELHEENDKIMQQDEIIINQNKEIIRLLRTFLWRLY